MNNTTSIDQLLNQEENAPEQNNTPNDDSLVDDILLKIKEQEDNSMEQNQQPSNVSIPVPPSQQQPPRTIEDPNPNSTMNQQIDPQIAKTLQKQQKEVRFMNEEDDDDDEEEQNMSQFELQNDVHFSLTDLIIRELRKPIIFAFLVILALLPVSNQLIERYLPVVAGSDVLLLTFKTFVCTLIFYVLNKLSLF